MSNLSNDDLLKAASSARFVALSQLGATVDDLRNWDALLVREPRLLVPVDVNALVVRQGDEAMVRLPFRSEVGDPPTPEDPGSPRDPGVHLMWTVPAAFGRGTIVADPVAPDDASRSTLNLRPLPDRWVVLRVAVPVGATAPVVRGWVLRADDGSVTPLTDYPTVGANTKNVGPPVPADQLNAQVGGPGWMECLDAALGRLALYDPLDDLPALAPNGVVGDALTYVVGGWWDRVENDPLDGVGSIFGYHDLLRQLGWDDPDHPEPEGKQSRDESSSAKVERTFNIQAATRYATSSPAQVEYQPSRSGFVTAGSKVATLLEAPTRSTLLHGRIHGVPWQGAAQPDDRPPVSAVGVALGPTSPSVSALLASGAMVQATTPDQQADAERLLAAFQSGLLARIGEPDVWPEIDNYEHLQGFGSLPGGIEAIDRFREVQRSSTDPGSGSRPRSPLERAVRGSSPSTVRCCGRRRSTSSPRRSQRRRRRRRWRRRPPATRRRARCRRPVCAPHPARRCRSPIRCLPCWRSTAPVGESAQPNATKPTECCASVPPTRSTRVPTASSPGATCWRRSDPEHFPTRCWRWPGRRCCSTRSWSTGGRREFAAMRRTSGPPPLVCAARRW